MTSINCKLGTLELGPGLPTTIILDYLRVYGEEKSKEDHQVIESLIRNDYGMMVDRARKGLELLDCKIVDLCIDHNNLDLTVVLPELAMAVHETTGQALSLDTRNSEALRRTLSIYPHKPIINSIPCEEEQIRKLMPLVAEFHTAAVLMLTDESGIPPTVDGRLRVAERLIKTAQSYSIPMEDIILDAAVLSPALVEGSMSVTLETLKAVRKEFGCTTLLGVANAGFGMPAQGFIIQAYIMAAIAAGVDVFLASYEDPAIPILYPSKLAMDFLTDRDPYGKQFLKAYRGRSARFMSNPSEKSDSNSE